MRCVYIGRSSAVNLKHASNLLKYLYHFLSTEDGMTTETFSVRVRLLISVSCLTECYIIIVLDTLR